MRNRLIVITMAAGLSSLAYMPFATSEIGRGELNLSTWIAFPVLSALVFGTLAAIGIWIADRTDIPMPLLRRLEGRRDETVNVGSSVRATLVWSIPAAVMIVAVTKALSLPTTPGTISERLLTTPFAALNVQIVVLLLGASLIYALMRRNTSLTVMLGGLGLALLHSLLGADYGTTALIAQAIMNGAMGAVFTWLYLKHGFEFAILGHALAHMIVMTFA